MNAVFSQIMDRLVSASVWGGIALAVALVATIALKRLHPTVLSWIWRLAVLKVILNFIWLSPIELRLLPSQPVASLPTPAAVRTASTPLPHSVEAPASNDLAAPTPAASEVDVTTLLGLAWMLGALGVVVVYGLKVARARRFLASCALNREPRVDELVERAAAEAGTRACPVLRVSAEEMSPVLIGFLRPVIVVPQSLIEPGAESDLRLVVLHELCHIRRLDVWWTALMAVCRTLLFFHPLAWISGRPWNLVQEAACDSLAIERSRSGREAYSDVLLRLMRSATCRPIAGLAVVPDLGRKAMMARRLLWIERSSPLSKRWKAVLVPALAIVAIGLIPWKLAVAASARDAKIRSEAPTPIGEVDWSTPKLASPAESGGFKMIGLLRVHEDGGAVLTGNAREAGNAGVPPPTLGDIPIIGNPGFKPSDLAIFGWPPLSTVAFVEIPKELRESAPNKYGVVGDDFKVTLGAASVPPMTPSTGYAYLSGTQDVVGYVLCVDVPIGYPDDVKSLTLKLAYKGKQTAQWTLGSLPKTPVLLPSDTKIVREQTVRGMTFLALAFRDTEAHGGRDRMVNWGVVAMSDTAKGQQWSRTDTGITFDRDATMISNYGQGGPDPVHRWTYASAPHPGELAFPAFSSSLKLAKIHSDITRYDTYEEAVELRGLRIEPSRGRATSDQWIVEPEYQAINDIEKTYRTPSGLKFRLLKQNGDTEPVPTASGANIAIDFAIDQDYHNPRLPNSPLFKRYHRPIDVSVEEEGLGYIRGYAWKDGRLSIAIDAQRAVKPGPIPTIKLKFVQRVDLETIPLDFVVPIVDQNLDGPVHKLP